MPSAPKRTPPRTPAPVNTPPEIVDPAWIVKALGIVVLFAAICGYITVCAFFYYGQWQLVLTPSRTVAQTPANLGLQFQEIHFGPDASGQPQLDGWWIPADLPSDPTVLMLHDGSGSMSEDLPQAQVFHDARLNVLLFDYRGFGQSGGPHPTEALMEQDSDAALAYLSDLRHIPAESLIIDGKGLGASLAARLCEQHHEIAAMVLDSADGDTESRVRHDSRARMAPFSLLFHEQFPLAARLHSLPTPKLLISYISASAPPANYQQAADPKTTVELQAGDNQALHESLRRFLDSYVTHPPAALPSQR